MPTPYAEQSYTPYSPPAAQPAPTHPRASTTPARHPFTAPPRAHQAYHPYGSHGRFWGEPTAFERKQAAHTVPRTNAWWHRATRALFGAEPPQPMPGAMQRKPGRHWVPGGPRGYHFAGDPALLDARPLPPSLPPGTHHPEHTPDGHPRPHGHHHPASRGAASSHHGDDDTFEPNYGAGDSGIDLDVTYEAGGGGIDPFAAAVFDDPGAGMAPQEWAALQAPGGIDVYDPREQIPNARNYLAEFGFEDQMYSGFGPAAVIGCEIGCGLDDAKLKG